MPTISCRTEVLRANKPMNLAGFAGSLSSVVGPTVDPRHILIDVKQCNG